tara:strand:- start:1041 stop:1565 length:525 start_codon:yes stop_codon:yes gene_type:complete
MSVQGILALDTINRKYVPLKVGSQSSKDSLTFTVATDDILSTGTTSIDSKLPSELDEDRLKTVNVKEWASQEIIAESTLETESSDTSSVVDLDGVGGKSLHLFISSNPVGATNLTVVTEQSFDNVTFYTDSVSVNVTTNLTHLVYTDVSRYVRFVVTNNDAESTDIIFDSGSFS